MVTPKVVKRLQRDGVNAVQVYHVVLLDCIFRLYGRWLVVVRMVHTQGLVTLLSVALMDNAIHSV